MSELHTRTKLRRMSINEMRDCIVEASEVMEFLAEKDFTVAKRWVRKWGFDEQETTEES